MIVNEIIENSLLSNNDSSYYELSILIGMDSFVFAVTDADRKLYATKHWSFAKTAKVPFDDYEVAFKNEPLLNLAFQKVSIGVRNLKYTLVPQKLYNKDKRSQYLENIAIVSEDDLVFADQIAKEKICNVFTLDKNVFSFFRKKYPNATFYHSTTPILHQSLELSAAVEEDFFLVNFHPQAIDIILIQNGKLKLMNSYPVESSQDCLYFILLIVEQFKLKQTSQTIYFSGGIDKGSQEFRQLEKYLPKLTSVNPFCPIQTGDQFNKTSECFSYFDLFCFSKYIHDSSDNI